MLILNGLSKKTIREIESIYYTSDIYVHVCVFAAQNFRDGGPWRIINDAVTSFASFSNHTLVIAIVSKPLEQDRQNIIQIIEPNSKRSWLVRLVYEKFLFNHFSRRLNLDISFWFAMHDITPIVKAKYLFTYYHNPTPFWRPSFFQALLAPSIALYSLLYIYVCRFNIYRNVFVIVQQNWIRVKILQRFPRLPVVVCSPSLVSPHPSSVPISSISQVLPSSSPDVHPFLSKPFFLCPCTPRVFKRIETAIFAFQKISTQTRLVITVSGNENLYTRYLRQISRSSDMIVFLGYQSRQQMDSLYSECEAVVFPSELETWGLPISEAISHRKTIFLPSLPYAFETAKGYIHAIYYDHSSIKSLSDALSNFLVSKRSQQSESVRFLHNHDRTYSLDCWEALWSLIQTTTSM